MSPNRKFILKLSFNSGSPVSAATFIAAKSGLAKMRVKDAMNKGALWIKKKKGQFRRLRKASAHLRAGDELEFYYDEELLSLRPDKAECIYDCREYSVWLKPAGLLSQGTKYGDHCSLMRQAELLSGAGRRVYLVHRLDREVAGVMLLAHSREAASELSGLFRSNLVEKRYRVEVLGNLSEKGSSGTIDIPLDGKPSMTKYQVTSFDAGRNTSSVEAVLVTGRFHQIRRHFEKIGFPVMGDPLYGKGNKNIEGVRLSAVSVRFVCPFLKKEVKFSLPDKIQGRCRARYQQHYTLM